MWTFNLSSHLASTDMSQEINLSWNFYIFPVSMWTGKGLNIDVFGFLNQDLTNYFEGNWVSLVKFETTNSLLKFEQGFEITTSMDNYVYGIC